MFEVTADTARNRLNIRVAGAIEKPEAEDAANRVVLEAQKRRPGFGVITDLRDLKLGYLSAAGILKGAMEFLQKPAELSDLLAHIEEAGARKAVLVEKRAAEQIADVIGKKSW